MNPFFNFPPFAFDTLASIGSDVIIPIVAIPLPFLFVIVIVGMKLLKDYRLRKLNQETIRILVDKGQPIPPELLKDVEPKKPANDRRSGLILIAIGIAIFFFFNDGITSANVDELCWIGLIPGLIGVAMLGNWYLEKREANKKTDHPSEQ